MYVGNWKAFATAAVCLLILLFLYSGGSVANRTVQIAFWLTLGVLSVAKLILVWRHRADPATREAAEAAGQDSLMPRWLRNWVLGENNENRR